MKNNKKDILEHRLMNYKRKSMQLGHRCDNGELTIQEWFVLEDELQDEFDVQSTGKDYVNFCKYQRLIGRSNHGKCNPKHDRGRRIVGWKKMTQNKKQKKLDKADKKIQEET